MKSKIKIALAIALFLKVMDLLGKTERARINAAARADAAEDMFARFAKFAGPEVVNQFTEAEVGRVRESIEELFATQAGEDGCNATSVDEHKPNENPNCIFAPSAVLDEEPATFKDGIELPEQRTGE